jgi:hypothetical protein
MKRWQSLFIALGLLAATALWAVPTFTPTLDGIQDAGWGTVPDHSTTSVTTPLNFNLDGGMYVSLLMMTLYLSTARAPTFTFSLMSATPPPAVLLPLGVQAVFSIQCPTDQNMI